MPDAVVPPSSPPPPLLIRPATFAEVTRATRDWHYTATCATANLSAFAVLERGDFVGVITFGSGASPSIGRPFRCSQRNTRELTRIALRPGHRTPVSRVIRIAAMLLKRRRPSLRVCVSYADSGQGHHGGVYQAAGWLYLGPCKSHGYRVRGRVIHPRTCGQRYGTQSVAELRRRFDRRAKRVKLADKHKYVHLWDQRILDRIKGQLQPYPKRPTDPTRAASIYADAPGFQPGEGGSTPTAALSLPPGQPTHKPDAANKPIARHKPVARPDPARSPPRKPHRHPRLRPPIRPGHTHHTASPTQPLPRRHPRNRRK